MSDRTVSVERAPRCRQGLEWVFTATPSLADEDILRAVTQLLDGERWTTQSTRLGEAVLTSFVVPFRFELRVGLVPGQLTLLHRMRAEEPARVALRERLAGLLGASDAGVP